MFVDEPLGLRGFGLRNFKCFRDVPPVELPQLTLLFGSNNSGKSSFIEGLLLPAHTLRSEDPGLALRMYSSENDFGTYTDIAHNHAGDAKVGFTYEVELGVDDASPSARRPSPRKTTASIDVEFGYLPQRRETYVHNVGIAMDDLVVQIHTKYPYRGGIEVSDPALTAEQCKWVAKALVRSNFLYEMNFTRSMWNRLHAEQLPDNEEHLFDRIRTYVGVMAALRQSLNEVYHLGPLRTYPARTYLHSGERPSWVGERGQYALQVFSLLDSSQALSDTAKANAIRRDVAQLGFSSEIRLRHQGDRHFELWTTHNVSGMSGNLADTGFGASQVLPVIVALHTAPRYSTLLIEQPELHLHPQAQAELGTVLARAAGEHPDLRLVVETHSENLLMRVQRETLEPTSPEFGLGNLSVLVAEPAAGGHMIRKMRLSPEASFQDTWPDGFWDDAYSEALGLTNARMRRRGQES